ncbi:3'-5' exonuclease [Ilyomonas limi]|nr:3'-5' exonuclease [Ilyomonas limi]
MNQQEESAYNANVFLQLEKPLIFFDLETTGLDYQRDRIVELSAIKLNPDGSQSSLHYLLNPCIEIPEAATEIHGITNGMVADKPAFCDVADNVYDFFKNCDLAGYNIRRFDIPILMEEFHRCKLYPILLTETKVIDVLSVYTKKEPRDLSAAVRYYCKEELTKAHSAQADVEATMKVLKHQLLHYEDLKPNVNFLYNYSCDSDYIVDFSGKFGRNKKGQIIYKFGKYRDHAVDLDNKDHQSYLDWLANESGSSVEMKMAIKRIKLQHHCHKICDEWLKVKGIIASADKMLALYQAIASETNILPFIVTRTDKKLTITYTGNEVPPLYFANEDEKRTALFLLKNHLNTIEGSVDIQSALSSNFQTI